MNEINRINLMNGSSSPTNNTNINGRGQTSLGVGVPEIFADEMLINVDLSPSVFNNGQPHRYRARTRNIETTLDSKATKTQDFLNLDNQSHIYPDDSNNRMKT